MSAEENSGLPGIADAARLIKSGETSPVELTQKAIDRISRLDGDINSFIKFDSESALARAEKAEKEINSGGAKSPLHGVPVALKDLFAVAGMGVTCGSKILENFSPSYDSGVARKLIEAGAVIIGKNNMDEFAMGSSNETSHFGVVKNPWDTSRVPGGSSGGCAAAVAAGLCSGAVGTDTGGSIRQPAAFCGVVGMKPTYGRVSRFGMVAFASSLDQAGPLARSVEDAAILLGAIAGFDEKDSTSIDAPAAECGTDIESGVKGMKIGIPAEYFNVGGMDGEVEQSVRATIKEMESLGAETVEISMPNTEYAVSVYYIIAPCEASSNLARYDGVRYGRRAENAKTLGEMIVKSRSEGFGEEVKRRIMLGAHALSSGYYDAYYLKAQKVRTLITKEFNSAFEKADVIMTPTAPEAAFKIGEKTDDPIRMYLSDALTIPANIAGVPAISVPCGLTKSGLPIGAQIIGKHFEEAKVLRAARALESLGRFEARCPSG
ncbi:MAG: Asp-tRNA(Asn)/Glu-tRNA(Gln) amidotransferase subunit GatA [Candidatus Mycalebacterium zealandia]|nr:MAG: Asp-tRNA(Asn)/Glu-tRNA(Gln) amidotransferase subunit GatA [Candidatus Mycalebacterium zealandia]